MFTFGSFSPNAALRRMDGDVNIPPHAADSLKQKQNFMACNPSNTEVN